MLFDPSPSDLKTAERKWGLLIVDQAGKLALINTKISFALIYLKSPLDTGEHDVDQDDGIEKETHADIRPGA